MWGLHIGKVAAAPSGERRGPRHVSLRNHPRSIFPSLEEMMICSPGNLKSSPPSELYLVTGPGVRGEMPRELWNAAPAYLQHSDRNVIIRPSSGPRTIVGAFSMAAELKGHSVGSSNSRLRHACDARALGFGEGDASLRGPAEKVKELVETAGRRPRSASIPTQAGGSTFRAVRG